MQCLRVAGRYLKILCEAPSWGFPFTLPVQCQEPGIAELTAWGRGRTRCPEVSAGSALSCELCWISFQSCYFVLTPSSASSCSSSSKQCPTADPAPGLSLLVAGGLSWALNCLPLVLPSQQGICSLSFLMASQRVTVPLGVPRLGCDQIIQVPTFRSESLSFL